MTDYDRIAATIEANLPRFRIAGALAVRPGYVLGDDGFPSQTPAIVVTVRTCDRLHERGGL